MENLDNTENPNNVENPDNVENPNDNSDFPYQRILTIIRIFHIVSVCLSVCIFYTQ